jgi:hypothetical protein
MGTAWTLYQFADIALQRARPERFAWSLYPTRF